MNVICAFHLHFDDDKLSFNVYKYNLFETFNMINVTSESLQEFFTIDVPNYHKHPIQFLEVDGYSNYAVDFRFWDTLLALFNASMSKTTINDEEFSKITSSDADVLFNEVNVDKYVKVYPHRETYDVLIVPHAQRYSDLWLYLQNETWTRLFVYVFVVIAVSSLLLVVSRYLQRKKILLLQCVVDVINLLINDNAGVRYQNLHRTDLFIIVPLTFAGLIVMNGILSLFQSYLTSPIYQHQINSIEKLYSSSVPILAHEYLLKDYYLELLEDMTKYDGWADKIHGTTEVYEEIEQFNNSIAFFMEEQRANKVLEVQKRLGLEVYYLLRDTFFGKELISHQVSQRFPFVEQMNDVVLRLNSAGLYQKWFQEDIQNMTEGLWNKSQNLQSKYSNESEVGAFSIPTVVWYGWIASIIAFGLEIVWNKMSFRRCRFFKRK